MDFLTIVPKTLKDGTIEIAPKFIIRKSKDLMIRGSDFYAIWDEEKGRWSREQDDAIEMIDHALDEKKAELVKTGINEAKIYVRYMWDSDAGSMDKWIKYCTKQMQDNYVPLDQTLVWADTKTDRKNYSSKSLSYSMVQGEYPAWEKLVSTLYNEDEREKLEWAIGAIASGASVDIQKFVVLYGGPGTGKSTILNIIQDMFKGYWSVFDAKALGSNSDAFALEPFKTEPLIAIQHDGDLSGINTNVRLNSLVSHETMMVNEKFKSLYSSKYHAMLWIGTNKPVKITDSKSGIIRRLIDISPSGRTVSKITYNTLMKKIPFEYGAIAEHCREVYENAPTMYDDYVPVNMFGATNDFYNFMEEIYMNFKDFDEITLDTLWTNYKSFASDNEILYPMKKKDIKEEAKSYFEVYQERGRTKDGEQAWNIYTGFIKNKFEYQPKRRSKEEQEELKAWTEFKHQPSILDSELADYPAQYEITDNGVTRPKCKWENCTTKLKDISTDAIHYVKVPENLVVIDFDLRDKEGNKSLETNLKAVKKWPGPETYAEVSKSGGGIHLHYYYDGDVSKLESLYDEHIEIKVFTGGSALRRKLTLCNNKPIAHINSGLPLREEKKVINADALQNEQHLRALIHKAMRKEVHDSTKPNIDFIYKILEDAYNSGIPYDVTDLRPSIQAFAIGSTHQSLNCLKIVGKMRFRSKEPSTSTTSDDAELVFFDVEVFPNLFLVVYKKQGGDCVRLFNPSPDEISQLCKMNLVGFNNRRYDNHILLARIKGYNEYQLFKLSQRIISGSDNALSNEAYNLSYTDVYDFASSQNKMSLKKWEIELGIYHLENEYPWDEPLDVSHWNEVAEYCENDVKATEAVFNHLHNDFVARLILADMSGLTANDTTNQHTIKILTNGIKDPQSQYVYTKLGEMRGEDGELLFPGYEYDAHGINRSRYLPGTKIVSGRSIYRGEDPGEGGHKIGYPGIYYNVGLYDVASMHPHSAIRLGIFGPEITKRFENIVEGRVAVKHIKAIGDASYQKAIEYLGPDIQKYLTGEGDELKQNAKALADALKTAINSVYGLTSAHFDNALRDIRNVDNIVAKYGALFMINLKHALWDMGATVVHVSTDSIKVANITPEIEDFIMEFGRKYGYTFEHEATYSKMCLLNDAVYAAYEVEADGEKLDEPFWTTTGTQFNKKKNPYVFKKLFSHEPIEFKDLCETKTATTAIYLDMNENLGEEHDYHFIGKVGLFTPIKKGCGGGLLLREKDGKFSAVTGSKGYRWMESKMVEDLHKESIVDISYYDDLVRKAIEAISEYGDVDEFLNV